MPGNPGCEEMTAEGHGESDLLHGQPVVSMYDERFGLKLVIQSIIAQGGLGNCGVFDGHAG